MTKIHGFEIKEDWKRGVVHARIKRWYMPIFIIKALHQNAIPLRFYPLVYWRHYTNYVKRKVL